LRIRLKKKWVGKRKKRRRLAEGLEIYVIRLKVECKGCVTAGASMSFGEKCRKGMLIFVNL
ncbi:hypothetical protein, partial [Butyrivibrio hungatei]|uniref:hypothetical protein n=1 Tax=Butyrivibrio hungatei TaxID=185008 RepID=UPI001A9A6525